jgi:hypothetical protein
MCKVAVDVARAASGAEQAVFEAATLKRTPFDCELHPSDARRVSVFVNPDKHVGRTVKLLQLRQKVHATATTTAVSSRKKLAGMALGLPPKVIAHKMLIMCDNFGWMSGDERLY